MALVAAFLMVSRISSIGRAATVRDGEMLSSAGLRNVLSLADLKMDRLLNTFDEWASTSSTASDVKPPERFDSTRVPQPVVPVGDTLGGPGRAVQSSHSTSASRGDSTWTSDSPSQPVTAGRVGARHGCSRS
jgi:putative flavoprotein involved in K+ transport